MIELEQNGVTHQLKKVLYFALQKKALLRSMNETCWNCEH